MTEPVTSPQRETAARARDAIEADLIEVETADTVWRFDGAFLRSNWACIWGRGCQGIEAHRAPELARGCCSVGAELDGTDEAKLVSALADTIDPAMFEHVAVARTEGIFSDETRTNTRVVDGACIFLNRPGFSGGAGCALHIAALAFGESPIEWKPSVCWQVPVKVDWHDGDDGREVATMRAWSRADWGPDGDEMAWWCTEGSDAYVGESAVIDSLAEEIEEIVGTPVFVELRRHLAR